VTIQRGARDKSGTQVIDPATSSPLNRDPVNIDFFGGNRFRLRGRGLRGYFWLAKS